MVHGSPCFESAQISQQNHVMQHDVGCFWMFFFDVFFDVFGCFFLMFLDVFFGCFLDVFFGCFFMTFRDALWRLVGHLWCLKPQTPVCISMPVVSPQSPG